MGVVGSVGVEGRWRERGVDVGVRGGWQGVYCESSCNVWLGRGARRINTTRPLPRRARQPISAGPTSFDAIACFFIAPINHALR